MSNKEPNDFERLATEKDVGFTSELWLFLKHSKKWWLLPLVISLILLGLLVYLAGSAAAPFIYTLF